MEEQVRYKVICPNCNENFDVAKSILMEMGINTGSCTCPQCKIYLHLECEENTKTMKAEDFNIFANKLKEKKMSKTNEDN